MKLSRSTLVPISLGVLVVVATVISSALGGPSLKKLVKKEVAKQLAGKTGPAGPAGSPAASIVTGNTDAPLTTTPFVANVFPPSGYSETSGGAANKTDQLVPNATIVVRDLFAE